MDLKDATRMYEHLRDRVFPRFSVCLLPRQDEAAEKEDVMRRFAGGEIQVLVAPRSSRSAFTCRTPR